MTTKITATISLTKGQWRTLQHIMHGHGSAMWTSSDASVRRVADIVESVAKQTANGSGSK